VIVAAPRRRWTPRQAGRRAREVVAGEGVRSLVFKVLGETVYRRLLLFERPLDPPPALREPSVELEYGFLDEDRAGELPSLGSALTPGEALRRLRRGERCFVARHRGGLVSARWLTDGEAFVEYLGGRLRLDENEVYVYEAFTAPAYRSLGLYGAASARLARELAAEGRVRTIVTVPPENAAAVRACEAAGYRRAGTIGFVGLGRRRRYFVRRRRSAGARV
jgi:hypothetical protein